MISTHHNPSLYLRSIKETIIWRDLLAYKGYETIIELLLPAPWLAIALWASYTAQQGSSAWYILTLIASFYFFLTGLRLAHNAFHYCLGISRFSTDMVMLFLSVLMLGSLHATQFTHLRHHRHCLGDKDVEGSVAKDPFWLVILKGPLFPLRIHRIALREAQQKTRRWIVLELFLNSLWIATVWLWWESDALKVHTLLMVAAYCFSAFFAVWTVHHHCNNAAEHWDNARTLRTQWKSYLFYNMFYHIEHHLFPQVPTCHLPELAKRLDQAGYHTHKKVF